jgi:AraC-like DNA-binding protein
LAKIAVTLRQALASRAEHGGPGRPESRLVASGDGWVVDDVVCTAGPQDRPYEEAHAHVAVAIVTAGSFQYRAANSRTGRELMTPGSLMLGMPGQPFECGHEHGAGDRCLSFHFASAYFERIAGPAAGSGPLAFTGLRVPPLRPLSALIARACAASTAASGVAWEEVAVQLAAAALRADRGLGRDDSPVAPSALARVTRAVRFVERHPDTRLTLDTLAREAGLSPYHFLRVFEGLTGVTPHQFILRARLRSAALRLAAESTPVIDIAFDAGFGDVSNFNRAFRAEFGHTPTAHRRGSRPVPGCRMATVHPHPRIAP